MAESEEEDWAADIDYGSDDESPMHHGADSTDLDFIKKLGVNSDIVDGDGDGDGDDSSDDNALPLPATSAANQSRIRWEISSELSNPNEIPISFQLKRESPDGESDDEDAVGLKINEYILVNKENTVDRKNADNYSALLGRGAFASVLRARNTENNEMAALKLMYKRSLNKKFVMKSKTDETGLPQVLRCTVLDLVCNELQIMLNFEPDAPCIISLLGVIDDPSDDRLFIALEYSSFGQIMDWNGIYLQYDPNQTLLGHNNGITIKGHRSHHWTAPQPSQSEEKKEENCAEVETWRFAEEYARKYILCVVDAITYLHSNRIIHRDLKPDNLLLFADNVVKLADFGTSEQFEEGHSGDVTDTQGTSHFFSPGACSGDGRNGYSDDIWAVGCILFIFLFATVPYHKRMEHHLMESIANDPVVLPTEHMNISENAKDLLLKILEKDEDKRIDIDGIKKHAWCQSK